MDLNPYRVTPTGEPASVAFPTDFAIEIAFRDSASGAVVLDLTGGKAITMSALLGLMTPEALYAFVVEVAPRMVALAEGLE
jgi:hypothetical protein